MSPDDPSPDSVKIAESLVLLEFVADLSGSLLPKDPALRAKARFFIDAVSTKFLPAFYAVVRGEDPNAVLSVIEVIQDLLPVETKGSFAVGDEFTIADASIAPFLGRLEVFLKNDIGAYEPGLGTKAWNILQSDHKYARYRKYFASIKSRDSFKATFDEVSRTFRSLDSITWI